MINLNVTKEADLSLFRAELTIDLPPITVVRHKAERDDLEYELRRAVEEVVGEIVQKQLKDEF